MFCASREEVPFAPSKKAIDRQAEPWAVEDFPSSAEVCFGNAHPGPSARLAAVHRAVFVSYSGGDFETRIENQVKALRRQFETHVAEVQKRGELAQQVLETFGLGDLTVNALDALADEALEMTKNEGTLDPLTFAERKNIDIRLADLVFRRLQRQGRISEAD